MTEEILPIETVDYLMIKWKKLASWEVPKTSAVAVIAVTIAYWYLNWTDATTMNLILYGILYAYLSVTFAQTIWPELRTENQEGQIIDVREEEVSESEISFMIEGTKNYYTVLKELRKDSPGLFCLFTCGVLLLLGYFGAYITILPLVYVLSISGLVLPIAIRKSPWMVQQIMKYSYIICMAFIKLSEILRSELPIMSDSAMHWIRNNAEHLQMKLKIYVQIPLRWMDHYKRIAREKFENYAKPKNDENDVSVDPDLNMNVDQSEAVEAVSAEAALVDVSVDPDFNMNVDQSVANEAVSAEAALVDATSVEATSVEPVSVESVSVES